MASCGFGFDIRLLMMGITSSVFLLNVVVVIVVVLRYESPNEKMCVNVANVQQAFECIGKCITNS